jgi:hypothetical protein
MYISNPYIYKYTHKSTIIHFIQISSIVCLWLDNYYRCQCYGKKSVNNQILIQSNIT